MLDEALGAAAWVAGQPSLTVRLETDFRLSIPLGTRCLVETKVLSSRHRVTAVEGSLRCAERKVYATARGRFMRLEDSAYQKLFGRPIPPKKP